jgi:hypothetical protein
VLSVSPTYLTKTAATHIQMMPKLIQYLSLFIMRFGPRMDFVILVKEIFGESYHQSLREWGDVPPNMCITPKSDSL